MEPKSSIFLRYTLTLTTFSQDEPAAFRTLPRLDIHWACGNRHELHGQSDYLETYRMLLNAAFHNLAVSTSRCLAAEENQPGDLCSMGCERHTIKYLATASCHVKGNIHRICGCAGSSDELIFSTDMAP